MSGATVLIDGIWTGHHPTYVKLFAAVLLGLGRDVTVLCPQPDEVLEWLRAHGNETAGRCRGYRYSDPEAHPQLPGALRALKRWRASARALREAAAAGAQVPELVFFTHLDAYLAPRLPGWAVDAVFPYAWSGLYFSPVHLRQRKERPRDAALAAAGCRSVGLLDEGVAAGLAQQLSGKPVVTFPDVADLSAPDLDYPLRGQLLERAAGRTIVGLLGCIDKRKGTLTLIEAAEELATEPFFFVFAGVCYRQTFSAAELERIDRFVASRPGNCLFHFGLIPDEAAFNALVQACDIIHAAYASFCHSSNLLTKAAYFGKPVIVSDGYCMAERVREFGLGQVIGEGDAGECVRALRGIVEGHHAGSGADGREAYMRQHALERLTLSLAGLLSRSSAGGFP